MKIEREVRFVAERCLATALDDGTVRAEIDHAVPLSPAQAREAAEALMHAADEAEALAAAAETAA